MLIPSIPVYIIGIAFLLLTIEYAGRCIRTRPFNYKFCSDALVYLYLGMMYLLYYFVDMPNDLRHVIIRFGIFLLAASRLINVGIEHYWRWRGDERRNNWLKLCRKGNRNEH